MPEKEYVIVEREALERVVALIALIQRELAELKRQVGQQQRQAG